MNTQTKTINLAIRGMTCGGCATTVERILADLAGVASVKVDLASARARVNLSADSLTADDIVRAILLAGYDAQVVP